MVNNFKKLIIRQRTNPKIYDFSFFLLKNNKKAFLKFKDLLLAERKKKILDVGCGFKPWKQILKENFEYIGLDPDPSCNPDIVGNAEDLPFPSDYFDGLIYSEVLEHVIDLSKSISEMKRIAKNNALVFISVPFVFPEHGNDYRRITRDYFKKEFRKDEILYFNESNSSLTMMVLISNLIIESTLPRCFPFNILRPILFTVFNSLGIFIENIVIFLRFLLPVRFKHIFSGLPLGFVLILRIKK